MRIHFIGIGGIGVSALARYYLATGHEVAGCDLVSSEITDQLKKLGVKIRIGKPIRSCVPTGTEKIIYSPAVKKNVLEIENWKLKIPTLSYPEALGELTKNFYTIAISGTHGKSTTTAMIGLLLVKAGLDPTVIVGTKLKEFGGSNFRMGKPVRQAQGKVQYLVIEADEHFASFLHYHPSIIVLTTVGKDHLDYYKNLKNIIGAFRKYILRLPKQGTLIANSDDRNTKVIVGKKNVHWYSLKQEESKKISEVIGIPGVHNVSNGLAVLAVARVLGIKDSVVYRTLAQYQGSWRRFEVFTLRQAQGKPFTLVSDYGHHPTEIRVTVQAAREKWPFDPAQGKPELWLVFQPHQYQRTYYLWKDFVKVLSSIPVQKLILCDIYDVAGREEKAMRKKVSSEKLAKAVGEKALYIPNISDTQEYLAEHLQGGEVVMVMGAGDIYNLTLRLTKGL